MNRRPETRSPKACSPEAAPQDRGLSLIELVLAMGLFALVAVMGAQALTGMLRLRDDLEARGTRSAALAEVTSLLRADLSALVPMLFYPPNRAPPQSALSYQRRGGDTHLALSRGGLPRFVTGLSSAGFSTGLSTGFSTGRVEWQVQDGQLSRGVWPSLIPAAASARQPQVIWGDSTALGGVQDLRLRSYWPQIGWVDGVQPQGGSASPPSLTTGAADSDGAGLASEVYSSTLPLAVELTLVTGAFGEITLLESLQ
ncbi:type II secretion system protein GspJ [Pseudophaeobacter sp.]|uniref:type II secretion system protein GspJ n=1 Tax=Pseudophaeobacter sp. TaxID=1971739 RepID=UPI0032995717